MACNLCGAPEDARARPHSTSCSLSFKVHLSPTQTEVISPSRKVWRRSARTAGSCSCVGTHMVMVVASLRSYPRNHASHAARCEPGPLRLVAAMVAAFRRLPFLRLLRQGLSVGNSLGRRDTLPVPRLPGGLGAFPGRGRRHACCHPEPMPSASQAHSCSAPPAVERARDSAATAIPAGTATGAGGGGGGGGGMWSLMNPIWAKVVPATHAP